jgi:hypothetical protein
MGKFKKILTKIHNFLRQHQAWLIILFALFAIAGIILFVISYYDGGNKSLVFWGKMALTASFSASFTFSLSVSVSLVKNARVNQRDEFAKR